MILIMSAVLVSRLMRLASLNIVSSWFQLFEQRFFALRGQSVTFVASVMARLLAKLKLTMSWFKVLLRALSSTSLLNEGVPKPSVIVRMAKTSIASTRVKP